MNKFISCNTRDHILPVLSMDDYLDTKMAVNSVDAEQLIAALLRVEAVTRERFERQIPVDHSKC